MKQVFGTFLLSLFALVCMGCDPVQKEKKYEDITVSKQPIIVLETNQGTIELQLLPQVAPKASENFIKLAEKGYYNGVIFHRVIENFMIQGGDPTGTGRGGSSFWGSEFEDEFDAKVTFDKPGLLAMANRGPHTNGSQFFITTAPTPWLNRKHTIFGEVIKGYDVIAKIEKSPKGPMDKPVEDIAIKKAYIKLAQ
jgi:peptidylprolyl isomerase